MAAVVFVSVMPRHWKLLAPKTGNILECARSDATKRRGGNADVGDRNSAAMKPSGKQKVARFFAKEGDGVNGVYRGAHHRAGCPVDAARQVHGDDRSSVRVHRFDHGAREALHPAV